MPFDALFLTAVRCELEGSLTGCRVDKVQQPQRDTLILSMRGAAGGGKLLLTASPNHPRIHLTNEPAENPAQPPMFCMLLRKHLTGGRLVGMQQPEMERLLDLTFDCTDEMGSPTQKHLILEIMGRNSNLILTAEDGRILDCLRRVDFEMSEQRQVLPGLYYHLPPTQGKRDPFAVTQEELTALLAAQRSPLRRLFAARVPGAGVLPDGRSGHGCGGAAGGGEDRAGRAAPCPHRTAPDAAAAAGAAGKGRAAVGLHLSAGHAVRRLCPAGGV